MSAYRVSATSPIRLQRWRWRRTLNGGFSVIRNRVYAKEGSMWKNALERFDPFVTIVETSWHLGIGVYALAVEARALRNAFRDSLALC